MVPKLGGTHKWCTILDCESEVSGSYFLQKKRIKNNLLPFFFSETMTYNFKKLIKIILKNNWVKIILNYNLHELL
jgi:hypothetical protein